MPIIKAFWLVEHHLLYARATGTISLEELKEHDRHLLAILDKEPAPIHIFFDTDDSTRFPFNLTGMKDATRFSEHPNMHWGIAVVKNPIVRFLSVAAAQFNGRKNRYYMVGTREEALQFVRELDPMLASLTLPDVEELEQQEKIIV